VDYLGNLKSTDFVYFLISGGGSSLITLPEGNISLGDLQIIYKQLLDCGATINEINAIRKHIDQVKGGKLIELTYPAGFCTLILSDVIGDPVDVIASGPTVLDTSTFGEAWQVIEKYGLQKDIPQAVYQYITDGVNGFHPETPKQTKTGHFFFAPIIIAGNRKSLYAASAAAESLGWKSVILSEQLIGEARKAGPWILKKARQFLLEHPGEQECICFLAGGETTVTLQGTGKGGRNLEVALSIVEDISELNDAFFCTFATDGEDGPTEAAGAWVTPDTHKLALSRGISTQQTLENHDSYTYFEMLEQLILTGSTGTNVNDISFLLIRNKDKSHTSEVSSIKTVDDM